MPRVRCAVRPCVRAMRACACCRHVPWGGAPPHQGEMASRAAPLSLTSESVSNLLLTTNLIKVGWHLEQRVQPDGAQRGVLRVLGREPRGVLERLQMGTANACRRMHGMSTAAPETLPPLPAPPPPLSHMHPCCMVCAWWHVLDSEPREGRAAREEAGGVGGGAGGGAARRAPAGTPCGASCVRPRPPARASLPPG